MTLSGRPLLLGWLFLLLSPLAAAAGHESKDAAALAKKWKIPLAAAQAVEEINTERPTVHNQEQWRAWVNAWTPQSTGSRPWLRVEAGLARRDVAPGKVPAVH